MQINITTIYNIGDILYLQQTNGGGLRKVRICGINLRFVRRNSSRPEISYTLNRSV